MIKESVTLDETIAYLNRLLMLDREAIRALIETRVVCNESLADHPSVQVMLAEDGGYLVGLLGILNGLFGTFPDGWGSIVAIFDDNTGALELEEFFKAREEDHR